MQQLTFPRYRFLRWSIVIAGATGAWVSGTLVADHEGAWDGSTASRGILGYLCRTDAPSSANCEGVVGSRWGSFDIMLGSRQILVPTSLLGLVYFLTIAIWFLLLDPFLAGDSWLRPVTLVGVSCGFGASLLFLGLMATVLDEWCPLCTIAHGLNGVIFISTIVDWIRTRRCNLYEAPTSVSPSALVTTLRRRLVLGAGMTCVCAGGGSLLHFDAVRSARRQWRGHVQCREAIASMQNDPDFMMREFMAQPMVAFPGSLKENPSDSNPEEATLVLFTDYGCSACKCFEKMRKTLVDEAFLGALRVEIRHAPTDDSWFEAGGSQGSDPAPAPVMAALAAEAARRIGGEAAFLAIHQRLFEFSGHEWELTGLAASLGVDSTAFRAVMRADAVRESIKSDRRLAGALNVTSTPAAFLNGRRVPELCLNSSVFWNAVAQRLRSPLSVASLQSNPNKNTAPQEESIP